MMPSVNFVLVAIVLMNLLLYGSSRLVITTRIAALQGLAIGILALLRSLGAIDLYVIILVGASTLIKAVVLPLLLARMARRAGVRREADPPLGFVASSLAGLVLFGLSVWLVGSLPFPGDLDGGQVASVSFFTVLTGIFLLVARRQLLTQVAGILFLENGVHMLGLSFAASAPLVVEVGILLDVTVAIALMVAILHHIRREVSSLDAGHLAELRD